MMSELEYIRSVLSYDAETGVFTWKKSTSFRTKAGCVAGGLNKAGYWTVCVNYKHWLGHRLAHYLMTGAAPAYVDHVNMDRADNRWVNLRVATNSENMANMGCSKANTTGFKGVSTKRNKWRASIKKDGKHISLGVFDTPEEAHAAYVAAATRLFGEFARAA